MSAIGDGDAARDNGDCISADGFSWICVAEDVRAYAVGGECIHAHAGRCDRGRTGTAGTPPLAPRAAREMPRAPQAPAATTVTRMGGDAADGSGARGSPRALGRDPTAGRGPPKHHTVRSSRWKARQSSAGRASPRRGNTCRVDGAAEGWRQRGVHGKEGLKESSQLQQ